MAHSPVAARRRLRVALRQARARRALTQEQVAEAMDWSLSKLIRIESGLVSISTNDLRAMLGYYQLTDADEVQRLLDLGRVGRARPWWSEYKEVLASAQFMTMIGLEADANLVRTFNSSVVPGLLQTEAYARSSLRTLIPEQTEAELDVKVAVRQRRQAEVLDGPEPPELVAVLDEAVLRRIPDQHAMRGQVEHLRLLAERPNITIEVVPFSAGVHELAGQFTILAFPDGEDPDVVYLENFLNEVLIEDADRIKPYCDAFAAIRARALDARDSLALLARVADGLR